MKTKIYLWLLIVLGFTTRLIFINRFPPSLNWDEVSHGFNAYSILKTGRDEWGSFMPLIFRCYGDFKLPLYIYSSIIPIFFLGLNQLSVRFISVLSGTVSVIFIYRIIQKILPKNKKLPIIAAAIFCFSPITIFLSRIALEANLFMCLFLISFYFLLSQKYGLSSFLYGLCLFTYNSSRVLLPFYLLTLIFLVIKNKSNLKKTIVYGIPFLILCLLAIYQTLNQSGQARYQWVSLLDSGSVNQINELRQTYPRFLVNKATYFVFYAAKNYLSHFSPRFLFVSGGSNYQFNIPDFYLISPLFLPFLILGLVYIIKNIKNDRLKLILFWFFVSPIPSSITRDAPHTLRSILFLPLSILIISLGFNYFLVKFKHYSIIYFFIAIVASQISFWPKYFSYSQVYSSSWQYGYSQMVSYIKSVYQNYDTIFITKKYGEPHEFILFNWPWDPNNYQFSSDKNWNYHATWYWVDGFDKFVFLNDWEVKDLTQNYSSDKPALLITSPGNYHPDSSKLLQTIKFLDGSIAFEILETNE